MDRGGPSTDRGGFGCTGGALNAEGGLSNMLSADINQSSSNPT